MRQKELRIALVCYGGISLAVYMHGVTKELWHLARASRDWHGGKGAARGGVERVYGELLALLKESHGLQLRVLPDILTGASAGGINAVFLAQAVYSGQSLEPLTDLWLEAADSEQLIDPDARPLWRFAKIWAQPLVWWLMRRPGGAVATSVAPPMRSEVTRKISRLIRGRWFEPPFSGDAFSGLLLKALDAMAAVPADEPLLPPAYPLDLYVTATDFHGHRELLRLNSPPLIEETEHRLPIAFRRWTPRKGGQELAFPLELVLAARATASFPGAFPPLQLAEIDRLAEQHKLEWRGREAFLRAAFKSWAGSNRLDELALIDGSVLVNAPFAGAMAGLDGRPAQREVDRRFIYIDPRPDRVGAERSVDRDAPPGFFATIFGSLSTIPREQPIRDNLEALNAQSRNAARLRRTILALTPEVERTVERLFGNTFFLDRPTPRRLKGWRRKAQEAAAAQAGYAFHAYTQAKFNGLVQRLARLTAGASGTMQESDLPLIELALQTALAAGGLERVAGNDGGISPEAVAFFRSHDIGFRIRRMRLIARRLARDWEPAMDHPEEVLEAARNGIYRILALYVEREDSPPRDAVFTRLAGNVVSDPAAVLQHLAANRLLPATDSQAEHMLAETLEVLPRDLRRKMLLTYLGFPFYDAATFNLLHNDSYAEFDPIKVDRISPDDALSIRSGGTRATLRGIEFYNFGAFFSRAYRENDYLWGRLHGAERMIDLVFSTLEEAAPDAVVARFKREAFLAILEQEEQRLTADAGLVAAIRAEVLANGMAAAT
ncbi:patatin-like protein [Porphyrobacter sp. GA68]|uniref:patatin-like protein n=1 Tax=Porphyrobacter sp. GA68 TaxID=2883480 RepID=UPI001D17F18A|nr:patatin-like protein [Porphyrobacter sp. GA68]